MKEKINVFQFITISIGIVAFCFFLSKLFLCKFGISSDFLSSSATLIAALIAYTLFDDWKSQFKTGLFDRIKDRFYVLYSSLESSYNDIFDTAINLVMKKDLGFMGLKEFYKINTEFNNNIDKLIMELDFYEKLRRQFFPDVKLKCYPEDAKKELLSIMNAIKLELRGDRNNLNSILDYLSTQNGYEKLLQHKRAINSDLQNIILNSIDSDKKGH